MITIDQKVRFDAVQDAGFNHEPLMVTGTVFAVNYGHKVFHVVYDFGGVQLRTSFKFCEIGSQVTICGGI